MARCRAQVFGYWISVYLPLGILDIALVGVSGYWILDSGSLRILDIATPKTKQYSASGANQLESRINHYQFSLSLTSTGLRSAIEERTFKHSYISACLDLGAHLWICFTSRVGVRRAPLSTIKSDRVGRPRPPPGGRTGPDWI